MWCVVRLNMFWVYKPSSSSPKKENLPEKGQPVTPTLRQTVLEWLLYGTILIAEAMIGGFNTFLATVDVSLFPGRICNIVRVII